MNRSSNIELLDKYLTDLWNKPETTQEARNLLGIVPLSLTPVTLRGDEVH